jgi:4-hydroxy-tetrahydrodipicolinate synthase
MRPYTSTEIRGTYSTLLLPIQADESIDFGLLQEQLQTIVSAGVDGVYSNGTAGEFYSLSEEEFVQVNQLLAETCEKAHLPFQVGAAFPSPQLALQRIKRAAEFRPSAIQVILPDWYPPALAESILFLERASDAADGVPLVLYNPPHAKRVLCPQEIATLCDRTSSLVGLKTGAGDDEWYQAMKPLMKRISVFVPGHSLATAYPRGAAGSYSNVACLQPRGAARWRRLMDGDLDQAVQIEQQIQGFMGRWILPFREKHGHSNMALDKLLAWVGGWSNIGTRLRWPYLGIDVSDLSWLRLKAREEIPFLFEP